MKLKNKILVVSTFFILLLNLILKVEAEPNPDFKNNIPVVFGVDENYFYPCVVSMTSLLENANENTFYDIYVIHGNRLTERYRLIICSLKELYKNCDIKLCLATNQFDNYIKEGYYTNAIFYRLEIPSIVEEDKCIYLDSDTIVNGDLSELFNINIDDYYVAGIREGTELHNYYSKYLDKIGMKNKSTYINSGVILWNLKKVRSDNLQPLFYEFLEKRVFHEAKGFFPDQDCINFVCDGKIMNLSIKFNAMTRLFSDVKSEHVYEKRSSFLEQFCEKEDWENAKENPVIIHYVGPYKPWKGNCKFWNDIWWTYASKSKFAEKIKLKYCKG